MNLRQTITNIDSRNGRRFDIFIQVLIILSLIAYSIETLPDLDTQTRQYLWYFEVVCVVIFTIEYILRLIFAKKPLGYVFSFYGIIDLLAILPFYLSFGVDLRSVRIFRIFRVFRILKLARYNTAMMHFRNAALAAREEIILFIIITLILLFLSAFGIYYFEHDAQPEKFASVFHSLWWSIATLTTVGYGDIYPVTMGGKIFTFCILIIGLGIVTVPAGIVASALSVSIKNRSEKSSDEKEL
ncbi:ion transporter [Aureitalea sp. L0-47]|uniref:ion transporter n=1 Tax=Aureitalea sp. L0-47 TaxID=2816962 RepID=UPI002237DA55|nr:ion transporter [Aureitalea sp. L0-47]MCW5520421.1 ion transporter [Aureitalea sp. L0-47]